MRCAGLDLIKWAAILSMLADHLRYLWPGADALFVVGRLAFPLFCLAIALNVQRSPPQCFPARRHVRYLGWMLLFSVLAEAPYRWLDHGSATFSVMPTLALGLLLAWGVQHRHWLARGAALVALLLAGLFSQQLMYGLPGVLLPAAILLGAHLRGAFWLLPCALAVAGNFTNSWLRQHPLAPMALLVALVAALALPVGAWLLRQVHWRVPPVGRWGYAFYPLHLLVIKGVQALG